MPSRLYKHCAFGCVFVFLVFIFLHLFEVSLRERERKRKTNSLPRGVPVSCG